MDLKCQFTGCNLTVCMQPAWKKLLDVYLSERL